MFEVDAVKGADEPDAEADNVEHELEPDALIPGPAPAPVPVPIELRVGCKNSCFFASCDAVVIPELIDTGTGALCEGEIEAFEGAAEGGCGILEGDDSMEPVVEVDANTDADVEGCIDEEAEMEAADGGTEADEGVKVAAETEWGCV